MFKNQARQFDTVPPGVELPVQEPLLGCQKPVGPTEPTQRLTFVGSRSSM